MDLHITGEEKKEALEERGRGIGGNGAKQSENENENENESDDQLEELGDLPPEIAERIGRDRLFESDEDLYTALGEAGFGDLRVVLVEGKPRLVMPSDQHNGFTTFYVADFNKDKGRWGVCSGTHKIHLSNGRSRYPDLSYWGYPRCDQSLKRPIDIGSIPDVVIQFSWQNKRKYEEDAIDDMMNCGLEKEHGAPSTTRPTLGYLIKVKFSKKRTLSGAVKGSKTRDMEALDIYRLPHGTTVAQACDPNNSNADHWRYVPGGQEIFITIAPRDLGITGFWASLFYGEYKIKASELFAAMEQYQKERQRDGLAM